LANGFIAELDSYSAKIAGNGDCQRISTAVKATVKLLKQCQSVACHASTIDELIGLILTNRCDTQLKDLEPSSAAGIVGLRYAAVRKAKIATTACFLDKEVDVLRCQISKYKDFIQSKVLDETGVSTSCQQRLQKSSVRILTFNYDRLFELAFFAGFADAYVKHFSPYSTEVLNSGLTAFGSVAEIQKDRFCFLKLHGSIGIRCTEDAFGQNAHQICDVANLKEEKITDALFFPEKQPLDFPADPLIIFPYEKDFILSGKNNRLPFREYIDKVWSHATYVLEEASEIWIIGYSFRSTDSRYLIDRMLQAKNCDRIVIQNLQAECDRIEEFLNTDQEIEIPITKYSVPF